MEYHKIIVNCRIEEVSLIGRIYISNVTRDRELLFTKSKDYTTEYIKKEEDKLVVIEAMIQPMTVTEAKKKITERIQATIADVSLHIDDLERYIRHAKDLIVASDSFRLPELRSRIHNKSAKGVIQCIKNSMVIVDNNLEALKLAGLTDDDRHYYDEVVAKLTADKVLQSAKGNYRRLLSQANTNTMNDFLRDMLIGLKDGFGIFKKNPALQKDYTFVYLRSQVRLQHKPPKNNQKEILGAVSGEVFTKATHLPMAGVQVRALNTNLSTTTDANGEYMIEGVTTGLCAMMFKTTGCKDLLAENIVIKAGKETDFNVEMEGG